MDDVVKAINIVTDSKEECIRIGESICNQLGGNQDYIDSNILVNYTDVDNEVRIYIFKECTYVPPIVII